LLHQAESAPFLQGKIAVMHKIMNMRPETETSSRITDVIPGLTRDLVKHRRHPELDSGSREYQRDPGSEAGMTIEIQDNEKIFLKS
jgi:hypothetical protein